MELNDIESVIIWFGELIGPLISAENEFIVNGVRVFTVGTGLQFK